MASEGTREHDLGKGYRCGKTKYTRVSTALLDKPKHTTKQQHDTEQHIHNTVAHPKCKNEGERERRRECYGGFDSRFWCKFSFASTP